VKSFPSDVRVGKNGARSAEFQAFRVSTGQGNAKSPEFVVEGFNSFLQFGIGTSNCACEQGFNGIKTKVKANAFRCQLAPVFRIR
jgi:hypothetical protein